MLDLNVGYSCDHRAKEYVTLVYVSPTVYDIELSFVPLQSAPELVLTRNEVVLTGLTFVFQNQRTVRVTGLVDAEVDTYPVDDYEMGYKIEPELCPKCYGGAFFGAEKVGG